jgi:hypothetical protein
MSFFSVPVDSALNVELVRHRLQVSRVDAVPDSTQMVERKLVRDGADHQLVRHPVSYGRLFRVLAEDPVSLWDVSASPKPAGVGLFNLAPEPLHVKREYT